MQRYFIHWQAKVNPNSILGTGSLIFELEGEFTNDVMEDLKDDLFTQLPNYIQAFDPDIVLVTISWLPGVTSEGILRYT